MSKYSSCCTHVNKYNSRPLVFIAPKPKVLYETLRSREDALGWGVLYLDVTATPRSTFSCVRSQQAGPGMAN